MSETCKFCKSNAKYLVFSVYRLHVIFIHSITITSPSTSTIIPTIQSELPIPIHTTTSPGNNLNTSVTSLETETCPLKTSNKFAVLSTEIQPLVSLPAFVPTTSNGEHSNGPEIPKYIKRNSRSRRNRPKVQKPEIEIKKAPHRPRKSVPTEYATDEEDMITYEMEEDELESNPQINSLWGDIGKTILTNIYALILQRDS
ncbi:hypothetical protein TNCV_193721 [Trichonephila clavipes]|nr:hypothetical protein TNCV_193721 [Trichonephila clavipes]